MAHLNSHGIETNPFAVRHPLSIGESGPEGEVLVHCAGIAHASDPDDAAVHRVNHQLAVQTCEWAKAHGYRHLIFLSSTLVWDDSIQEIRTWTDRPQPNTEYGRAKLAAEEDLNQIASEGFLVSVIRLPLVYGPGVKGNLARLIDAVATWPLLPLGSSTAERSLTGVETLNGFIQFLIRHPQSGVFTLVDSRNVSTQDMIHMIAEGLPTHGIVISAPAFAKPILDVVSPSVSKRLFGSRVIHDRSVRDLGYNPTVSDEKLAASFREMAFCRYRERRERHKEADRRQAT